MERELNERGRAGVADAVLLEDFTNENAFIENLEKRFHENFIYVSMISSIYFKSFIKLQKQKSKVIRKVEI